MCFLGIYVILQLLGSLKSVPLKPELPVLDVVSLLQIDEHALFAQQQVLAASAAYKHLSLVSNLLCSRITS